jgi:hypothetical protein
VRQDAASTGPGRDPGLLAAAPPRRVRAPLGPRRWQGAVFALLALLTLGVGAALSAAGRPLHTAAAPYGIISLELSGSAAGAQAVLASWDEQARLCAAFVQGLDYLYLCLYGPTLALGCLLAGRVLRRAGRISVLGRAGRGLCHLQLVAAALDVVENGLLWRMLRGAAGAAEPALAAVFAAGKFALVGAGLVYMGLGLLVWILQEIFAP